MTYFRRTGWSSGKNVDMNGDSMSSQLGPFSTWMGDLIRRLTEGIDVSCQTFFNTSCEGLQSLRKEKKREKKSK